MQTDNQKASKLFTERDTYTEEQILALKQQLEKGTRQHLVVCKNSSTQMIFECKNSEKHKCSCLYRFQKVDQDPNSLFYKVLTRFQSHENSCLEENMDAQNISSIFLRKSSFHRYQAEKTISIPESPDQFPLIPQSPSAVSQKEENWRDDTQIVKEKLYIEEQFSLLKKELEFESRGTLSRMTEYHHQLGYVTQVHLKCKFEKQCPFLCNLTYTYERDGEGRKLYQLTKENMRHLPGCILDDEDIYYNAMVRKIDQSQPLLMQIIIQKGIDSKPKTILEQLTKIQGEETIDFLYRGLQHKIKKRGIKKYFDNMVAKAKNLVRQS